MKMNPVYKRETTVSSRSFRLALIIMVFNGILALVALLNMYSVVARVKITAEIQYSSFLNLYVFVSVVEFVMLMFIMPALTAGTADAGFDADNDDEAVGDYIGKAERVLLYHVYPDCIQLSAAGCVLCIRRYHVL